MAYMSYKCISKAAKYYLKLLKTVLSFLVNLFYSKEEIDQTHNISIPKESQSQTQKM